MPTTAIDRLRGTQLWSRLRDWRYLHRHRGQRRFLAGFIHRGDLVFDIGANVGHYTLVAISMGAQVVAVEPQAALAGHLRRRFSSRLQVQVLQCALGASSSTAALHKTPDQTEIASLREDFSRRSRFASAHEFSQAETVEILPFDELIARHGRPQFCKIDVEGYESAVLAGLNMALPSLSFEFNREFQDDTGRCLERLDQLGRYRYNYSLGETYTLAEPRWLTSRELQAGLWLRPDPLLWGDIYARTAS